MFNSSEKYTNKVNHGKIDRSGACITNFMPARKKFEIK